MAKCGGGLSSRRCREQEEEKQKIEWRRRVMMAHAQIEDETTRVPDSDRRLKVVNHQNHERLVIQFSMHSTVDDAMCC